MVTQKLSLPSESDVVLALGSRTTMLHPELLRHRAWWREILGKEVHKRRAELATDPRGDEEVRVSLYSVGCYIGIQTYTAVRRMCSWNLAMYLHVHSLFPSQ